MALGKQAKFLTKAQTAAVLAYLGTQRHPERNRVIFLLSVRAGLRAKEISRVTWAMITTSDGELADDIALQDSASKRTSGRRIPISKELRRALEVWKAQARYTGAGDTVVQTERSRVTSAQVVVNLFRRWYSAMGLEGCSSHSGRRTFITNAARRISTVGGSLRDVQALAGHSSLATTQRYIEINAEAKRKVVELV